MKIIHILIVEDEEELWAKPMVFQLQRLARLQSFHLCIDCAVTACDARQKLSQNKYDFASLDLNIPEQAGDKHSDSCGVELSQFFRKQFPSLPFCIFSGRDEPSATRDITVFLKGTGEPGCLTAKGWAEAVIKQLQNLNFLGDD